MSVHLKAAYKARIDKLESQKAELNAAIDELKGVHKNTIVTPLNMSGEAIQAVLDALGQEKIRAINDDMDKRIAEVISEYAGQGDPAVTSEVQRIQGATFMRYMFEVQTPSAEGDTGS
ncbi:hypothetical protein M409DRAFT_51557 [Zasmidium cellare ATCC 36951]|uniref:Uncharacterized protein n=1 Tax=Zasmidium cellare ATCC 36951 TaxID=1080233 RepID=A0A6A6CXJ9_ZASCE|nr:uncharacterized protein M409DRAFT_51557 [Zasmidium cellare ATCC 36951]KAF2170529.1 hypothetical protein M409DRAFT_51557 [Zasmidium cellare ATCC 36951]